MRLATLAVLLAALQARAIDVPPGIAALLPAGHEVIAFETSDLDGDGNADSIIVTESEVVQAEDYVEHPRSLFVVTMADKKPRIAARNDRVVYCRECGGMLGDPFQGVTVERNGFSVSHYGGSGRRWSTEFVFRYSRRDRAWQLVKAVESSFYAGDPEDETTNTYKPDRDFGKIDLVDFDPDRYLRKKRGE